VPYTADYFFYSDQAHLVEIDNAHQIVEWSNRQSWILDVYPYTR